MVAVAGTGMTAFNRRKDGSGFRDWVREAFVGALASAELETGDLDSLVVASESDFFSLQLNPASVIADDLGMRQVRVQRAEGGGATGQLAVHAGASWILSGLARHVAVVGFEAAASALKASSVTELYGQSFDALTDGPTGVSATALYALSAKAFQQQTGATDNDFASVAVQNRRNAQDNPHAHLPLDLTIDEVRNSPVISDPYHRLDCSPLSDGAAVVILSAPEALPSGRKKAPRISGIGVANDRVRLGDRPNPGFFAAKQKAAEFAYRMAGVDNPGGEIEVAEVYDAYSGAQLQALQALGLSDNLLAEHRDGGFAPGGRLPVNLSGGLLGQGAPVGATGVAQLAACAEQMEGRYHRGLQMQRTPRLAVVDTHGGVGTVCAVTVLQGETP